MSKDVELFLEGQRFGLEMAMLICRSNGHGEAAAMIEDTLATLKRLRDAVNNRPNETPPH